MHLAAVADRKERRSEKLGSFVERRTVYSSPFMAGMAGYPVFGNHPKRAGGDIGTPSVWGLVRRGRMAVPVGRCICRSLSFAVCVFF